MRSNYGLVGVCLNGVLFALLVMLLTCFFHFRSLYIVIPRYLAESVIGKGWSWRVYVLRMVCLLHPACIV